MALALAVRPSTSRKMISIAASLIFAETRNRTALIVVMARMKKKVAVEKKATLDRGNTIRVKVVTGPAPRLTAASSTDLSICFRFAVPERTPRVKLAITMLMMMIQIVP